MSEAKPFCISKWDDDRISPDDDNLLITLMITYRHKLMIVHYKIMMVSDHQLMMIVDRGPRLMTLGQIGSRIVAMWPIPGKVLVPGGFRV